MRRLHVVSWEQERESGRPLKWKWVEVSETWSILRRKKAFYGLAWGPGKSKRLSPKYFPDFKRGSRWVRRDLVVRDHGHLLIANRLNPVAQRDPPRGGCYIKPGIPACPQGDHSGWDWNPKNLKDEESGCMLRIGSNLCKINKVLFVVHLSL